MIATQGLAAGPNQKAAFFLNQVDYFDLRSKNDQHEFTPEKQEDLKRWADMVTLDVYPAASAGEAFGGEGERHSGESQSHGAMVLKTTSVSRTVDRPEEHLIAVVFPRPAYIEVAFARFELGDVSSSIHTASTGENRGLDERLARCERARGCEGFIRREIHFIAEFAPSGTLPHDKLAIMPKALILRFVLPQASLPVAWG